MVSRDVTRKDYERFRSIMRGARNGAWEQWLKGCNPREDNLAKRVILAANIQELKTRSNKVRVHCCTIDCDQFSRNYEDEISANVVAVERWQDRFYEDAEGPRSWYFLEPETPRVEESTRDYALEAFENGHSYSITY